MLRVWEGLYRVYGGQFLRVERHQICHLLLMCQGRLESIGFHAGEEVRYWVLRKMYTLAWWLCDKTAPSEAPVFKGFYTRYKRPENVRDEELA